MIAIVNVSNPPIPKGVNEYELRINREVIARFTHKREEGLAVCLQKAAEAAKQEKLKKVRASLFKAFMEHM